MDVTLAISHLSYVAISHKPMSWFNRAKGQALWYNCSDSSTVEVNGYTCNDKRTKIIFQPKKNLSRSA